MLTALLNEAEAWLEMNAVQQADKFLAKLPAWCLRTK
jgi:hypothetical protein